MPQEKRKRGRRAEKKRKEDAPEPAIENLYIEDRDGDAAPNADADDESTFFGLLTEEEQEYFQRADEMLSLDQFGDGEGMFCFLPMAGGKRC